MSSINTIPKKILVVKLCCIGDVVFITPMLRSLRNAYPDSTIYYLAAPWVQDIVKQIPFVDEVIPYEAPLSKKSIPARGWETIRLLWKLRTLRIDTMLIGHRNVVFALLGKLAGVGRRIGFAAGNSSMLTHPVHFDETRYESERYFELLKQLELTPTDLRTEVRPGKEEILAVEEVLSRIGMQQKDSIIGIFAGGGENPGTSMPIKRWYPEHYASLCKNIMNAYSCNILLLGGSSDYELNQEIITHIQGETNRVANVANEFPLSAIPALMKRCALVIGGDSGPVHVASAVGTPTIFLFGPSDPRLVAPKNANSIYLWKHVECSPCYTPLTVMQKQHFQGNNFICWTKTHECIKSITVEEVFTTLTHHVKQLGIRL